LETGGLTAERASEAVSINLDAVDHSRFRDILRRHWYRSWQVRHRHQPASFLWPSNFPRQEHQVGRVLGVVQKRLARRAQLRMQFPSEEGAAETRKQVVAMTPLGRLAYRDEIACAALFLASDLRSYVAGIDCRSMEA
jgi:hypothetical protein